MDAKEIGRIEAYMRRTFRLDTIELRQRPRDKESVEVYIADEFIGLVFRDDEDDELSYNFQMAILEYDLEEM